MIKIDEGLYIKYLEEMKSKLGDDVSQGLNEGLELAIKEMVALADDYYENNKEE